MALNAVYRHPAKLAACVVMSGWLSLRGDFAAEYPTAAAAKTPCFWGHGTEDDKVLFPHQARGVADLEARGVEVAASQYPMGHSAHPEELARLAAFIEAALTP